MTAQAGPTASPSQLPPDAEVTSDSGMPPELVSQLRYVQHEMSRCARQARNDRIIFWALRLPAIAASASTALFATLGFHLVTALLGVTAAACISVDAIYPAGSRSTVKRRASYELHAILIDMRTTWRDQRLKARAEGTPLNDLELAVQILEASEPRVRKVEDLLRDSGPISEPNGAKPAGSGG